MSEKKKPVMRPVDADGTLVGYEVVRGEERLGFLHLEDIMAKPDPAEFVGEWIQDLVGPA